MLVSALLVLVDALLVLVSALLVLASALLVLESHPNRKSLLSIPHATILKKKSTAN